MHIAPLTTVPANAATDVTPFGAAVAGIDLTTVPDINAMQALANALYEHRLLLIKHQDLDVEQYYQFGRRWGDLSIHVSEFLRVPGYPEMMCIGNTEQKDRDPGVRNGAVHWHTDGSYKLPATAITMLYARKVPARGGHTLFCDMASAYDSLSESDQQLAEQSVASHLFGAGTDVDEHKPIDALDENSGVDPVKNSLVKRHPVTGRKALYGLGQSPYAIDGLSRDEALARIRYFKAHAVQPANVYEHRYEFGDIMLIDCLATMHKAMPSEVATSPDADNARIMWRLSTESLPEWINKAGSTSALA